jgi:hypothetical protein
MDVYLTTERLTLRAFTVDDLDVLETIDADPEVMRYVNGGHMQRCARHARADRPLHQPIQEADITNFGCSLCWAVAFNYGAATCRSSGSQLN